MSEKHYRTTSWYDPRVEIRPSMIQGGDMSARELIQAGEIVAIVEGILPLSSTSASVRVNMDELSQ